MYNLKLFIHSKTFKLTGMLFLFWLNVLYSQVGINVIVNGEFDNGKSSWTLVKSGSANAVMTASNDSVLSGINNLRIDIAKGGDSLAAIRVRQSINFPTGRYYKVSFMAAANKACNIQPVFNSSSTSANTIWKGPISPLSASPQHFGPYTYRNQLPDAGRAFSLYIGGSDSTTIWIDSVVIEMTDDPETIRPEEALVDSVKDILNQLIKNSSNEYLKLHFNSIINVIDSKYYQLRYNYRTLNSLKTALIDTAVAENPAKLSSYLDRTRPFIVAWTSPTDGNVSFAQALPPKDWDPNKTYPLYVSLHGLWNVADNPIDYLSIYLSPGSLIHEPYDDGYLLMPWGRGNLWYEGIAETDIWECIDALESVVKVDSLRKYLTGHSMGGYGAWKIGQSSVGTWAALGIHAGALWWNNYSLVNTDVAQRLKNVPVYFVVGDQDGLLGVNQQAYQLLQNAGNKNISFNTFQGDHVYLYDNLVGINNWIKNFSLDTQTDVKTDRSYIPSEFVLGQNYPNPFNPETVISYQLPVTSKVELKVFDTLGREVKTLVEKEQNPGRYEVKFDANKFSTGVYFYRLSAGNFTTIKKMILIK